MIILCNYNS